MFGIEQVSVASARRFCTPRRDEDEAAAREHWARVYSAPERVRQAAAREQLRALRPRRGELVIKASAAAAKMHVEVPCDKSMARAQLRPSSRRREAAEECGPP